MSYSRNPGPLPNRWLECPRKGKLIADMFMPFKTPLSAEFDDQVPLQHRFTPKMLFDICQKADIKFGLWIDLTNTSRFYDKCEIEKYECKYTKLSCRGFKEAPTVEETVQFINVVKNYIAQNPSKRIAVHCTHGFNRTGFLIVSYLVKEMDFSVNFAVDTFAEARPTGIYKQSYIDELFKRFGDNDEIAPIAKSPDWCSIAETDDGEILSIPGKTNNENDRTNKPVKNAPTAFMKGVKGVTYLNDKQKTARLQKIIKQICEFPGKEFPGCQPVSMDQNNINYLRKKPYMVSWKADGTRYMMFIDGENEVYFFDRNNTVFHVDGLRFVQKNNLTKHVACTLLDGEMVIDKVKDQEIPRYLVYDIVTFENNDIGKKPFANRLHCLETELIIPRQMAMGKGIIDKIKEPFSVRKKEFWHITKAKSLLGEKFAESLSHEPDGLIFQPSNDPYIAGRCDHVLKWKPLSLNSVDFRLKLVREQQTGKIPKTRAYLYVLGQHAPFNQIKYTNQLKDYNQKIIECKFENNYWVFMRERTDKTHPNSWNTAMAVCESINRPVTKELLLDIIERYRYADDAERMPPPSKKLHR